MARVHGIHRKRRRERAELTITQDKIPRKTTGYDGDIVERFELGGCLKSEPNPTLKCVRISRKFLLRCISACASRASFCSSPFMDRRSGIHSRASLSRAPPWCPHPTHVGASTQVAASDHAEEDWQVRAIHSRVGYLSSDGAAGPPHRRRADSQPALGPLWCRVVLAGKAPTVVVV